MSDRFFSGTAKSHQNKVESSVRSPACQKRRTKERKEKTGPKIEASDLISDIPVVSRTQRSSKATKHRADPPQKVDSRLCPGYWRLICRKNNGFLKWILGGSIDRRSSLDMSRSGSPIHDGPAWKCRDHLRGHVMIAYIEFKILTRKDFDDIFSLPSPSTPLSS